MAGEKIHFPVKKLELPFGLDVHIYVNLINNRTTMKQPKVEFSGTVTESELRLAMLVLDSACFDRGIEGVMCKDWMKEIYFRDRDTLNEAAQILQKLMKSKREIQRVTEKYSNKLSEPPCPDNRNLAPERLSFLG